MRPLIASRTSRTATILAISIFAGIFLLSVVPTAAGTSAPGLTIESSVFKPLGSGSVQSIIGRVISYILGLVGIIALVMFIYGGLTWMMAAGSQEKITKAKNTIVWAVLGIIMVFASYAIVSFVITAAGG